MKLVDETQDVLVGGAMHVEAFTIKASSQAFQILSSSLYSNKCGAVIRELSTNAYDAHMMVGKPELPFEITLPNSLEPTFKIRDFGPGLSEQEIASIYTTFFESTKSNSNDFVGCLGLGSKSPFAVSDSFTISSYYNGKKIIYSAFLNEARVPSIAKFAEFPTDETNGLEIEVAIKEQDFCVFNREVNAQLKYFKVKPTVFGNSDFRWHDEEQYLYEGDDWKLVKGGGSPRVVQGQIQYPISTRDMGTVYREASNAVKTLLDKAVVFEVPIGEVGIAPSREALSYDDRTCQNIVKYAEKIIEELPLMIKDAVDCCETRYQARIKYNEIIRALNDGYYSQNDLVKKIVESGHGTWKGQDITAIQISIPEEKISYATCYTKNGYNTVFKRSSYHAHTIDYDKNIREWSFDATDLEGTIWVHASEDDGAVEARAKQYVTNKFGVTPKTGHEYKLNIIKTEMTPVELAEELGIELSTLVVAKDLDKVKRATPTAKDKRTVTIDKFTPSVYGYKQTDYWTGTEVLAENVDKLEGYYVDLDRYNIIGADGKFMNNFKDFVSAAIEVGLITKDDNIYGLKKSVGKLKHNLVNLFDAIKEKAQNAHLSVKYVWGNSWTVTKFEGFSGDLKTIIANISDETSPAKQMMEVVVKNMESPYSYNAKRFIDSMKLHSEVQDYTGLAEIVEAYYPMIKMVSYNYDYNQIADYINQMDTLRALQVK